MPPAGRRDAANPDKVVSYLLQNAEQLFEPKSVYGRSDWLVTQNECGQTAKRYKQGGPSINWMDQRTRKIILFVVDQTISEETSEMFRAYCEAYFWGCDIEVVRPGGTLVLSK